jgi:hypothetical protein
MYTFVPLTSVMDGYTFAEALSEAKMTHRLPQYLLSFLGIFAIQTAIHAQTPTTYVAAPEIPVKLDTLWNLTLGADYMSSVDPNERNAHPYTATAYISSGTTDVNGTSLQGIQPLYRLLSPSQADHMDSTVAGEGGYTTEGILGYMWSSQSHLPYPLPSGIQRIYDSQPSNPHTGDHASIASITYPIPDFNLFAYYAPDGPPLGYGFSRYAGTLLVNAPVSGGGITVTSNVAAGCAVWAWNTQYNTFINDYDYGRQMQSAVYPHMTKSALGEAGDMYGTPDIPVDARHPSPCVQLSTSGKTQSTMAIPLDWTPDDFGGGINNPVIYPNTYIGKNLALDWIGPDGVDRNWPVALYQTVITSPNPSTSVVEAPTAYLTSQYNNYYKYDPTTKLLTFITAQDVRNAGSYNVTLGGVQAIIVATSDWSAAMGVYINDPNTGFVFVDNTSGNSPGEYGSSFVKWEVHYEAGLPAGPWYFNTWIATDSLPNVMHDIDQLYAWGLLSICPSGPAPFHVCSQ